MNKSQLKQALKPLIKECIKEVMFEDGILSGVITEVARGLAAASPVESASLVEQTSPNKNFNVVPKESLQQQRVQINEHKKQLLHAIGRDAYNGVNLFEGTVPLAGPIPRPGGGPASQGPMDGVAPSDPGVDISNLFGSVGGNWQAHLKAEK